MADIAAFGGQVAVVTGGAQGIGRAITERLSASGAKVAIWDRDFALAQKSAAQIGRAEKCRVENDVITPVETYFFKCERDKI